ncbi:hypothetical protein C0993_008488 [Termitomyces sp. T159_Od127]|nr:hypothetical protein C0993_008488 [Termitomyces sp. T159_Od127]
MPYSLPRRRHAAPVFHFNDSSDETDEDERPSLPQLKLRSRPTSFHGAPTVPFAPPVQRTNSSPILLSNGKPLKSSLKSSASSPDMPAPPARARAASTPSLDGHVPKNVHFPSSDLATVRFYSRSARPASLSLADPAADTETETESERPAVHELDAAQSSAVPAPSPAAHANVHLESLALHGPSTGGPLALKGTLLVRNLAYQKTVAVRFTLDNWDTTSEVLAHYTASLPALPRALFVPGSGLHRPPPEPLPACASPAWDRFAFSIRLDDYAPSLAARTLWLVARYSTPAAPEADAHAEPEQPAYEWWDNNNGQNYRVAFRLKRDDAQISPPRFPTPPPPIAQTRLRTLSLSNYAAPVSPTSPTAPPPQLAPPTPTLSVSSISDGSPLSLATPVDLVGMELVNGFPATGPSGLGFGAGGPVGLALDLGARKDDGSQKDRDDDDDDEKSRGVALYWPWGRPRPHPHPHHEDEHEHEHAVRVHSPPPPPRASQQQLQPQPHMHTLKNLPTRKRIQHREPSPPLSDSSSSSSSSSGYSSGSSASSGRRPRVGRRVFPPLVGVGAAGASVGAFALPASANGNKTASAPTQRESTLDSDKSNGKDQNKNTDGGEAHGADGEEKEKMEKDKIYQALVRKWCFAGPGHAQAPQRPHSPSHPPSHPTPHAQHGHGMGMGMGVVR